MPIDSPALLAADQRQPHPPLQSLRRGRRKPSLWCYPPESDTKFEFIPTDAKRVEIDDVTHILAAYHGRVQLICFDDQKVIKDYPSYSSCHSAELLPDGAIVTANSNHGMLRLHRSSDDFTDLKLPYAHGVTWDKLGKCMWALGDLLYRLRYADGELTIDKTFKLPLTPTGHDLFPLRDERKLLVSNNDALYLFDIASGKFELVSELPAIKSASQHLDGTLWASDPEQYRRGCILAKRRPSAWSARKNPPCVTATKAVASTKPAGGSA